MKILGIDTSSSSGGHALVEGDDLIDWGVWKPPTKFTEVSRMYSYYTWLNTWVGMRKSVIDMVAIEELGVMRGAKVARTLAHFEAIAVVVCKRHDLIVVRTKAGVARNLVLGINPNSSKEEAVAEVKRQYPHVKFPPVNRGGLDVADAFVQAKAAPLSIG